MCTLQAREKAIADQFEARRAKNKARSAAAFAAFALLLLAAADFQAAVCCTNVTLWMLWMRLIHLISMCLMHPLSH